MLTGEKRRLWAIEYRNKNRDTINRQARDRALARRTVQPKKGPLIRLCENCDKPFRPEMYNVNNGGGRFCSRKCSAIIRVKSIKRYKACENCGEQFHAYKRKMIFCSRRCAHIKRPPCFNPDRQLVLARKKMAKFCCRIIQRCLFVKNDTTYNMLGYTDEDLRKHIASLFHDGMDWNNYGHTGAVWHVDHKKPISSFPLGTHVSIINALDNLQPMWAIDNFRKHNKLT